MKRWWPLTLLVAGIGVGVWAIFFYWTDDEEKILQCVERFVEAVEVRQGENPLIRTGRLRGELKELVADHVRVSVEELGRPTSDRKQLVALAAQAGVAWVSVDASLSGIQLAKGESKTAAHVEADASITASEHGGRMRRDERRVLFDLEKIDGDWRITSIVVNAPSSGETP